MKKFTLILGIMVFATGCVNLSTPRTTSQSASNAILKNNLSSFKATLSGNALDQFGTSSGLTLLGIKLRYYKNLDIASESLVSHEEGNQGHGFYGDVLRNYELSVTGNVRSSEIAARVLTLLISCKIKQLPVVPGLSSCYMGAGGHEICPHADIPDRYIESQSCLINDIILN